MSDSSLDNSIMNNEGMSDIINGCHSSIITNNKNFGGSWKIVEGRTVLTPPTYV